MSDSPDHLDPKEATEAKLCAYLEGELSPTDRAEIEQHLAANPQHRKLLADLAQTREWMRAIPRESAPSDLAESFQGQVERTMLLDDAGDIGSGALITRWPQYLMIAAIVTLVLGLGVVLAIILKGPSGVHDLSVASSTPATKPAALGAKAMDAAPEPEVAVAPTMPVAVPAAPVTSPQSETTVAAPVAVASETSVDRDAVRRLDAPGQPALVEKASIDQIKTKLASSGYRVPQDAKTICFVVRSDAPATTVDQVRGFFTRHQLMLEEPASLPSSRAQQTTNADQAHGALAGGANAPQKSQNGDSSSTRSAATAAQNEPPPAQNAAGGGGGGFASNNAFAGNVQQSSPAGGTNPSKSAVQQVDHAVDGLAAETLYVAHGLTPLQIELLNASLATDNPNLPVKRLTLSVGNANAGEQTPISGTIAKGQMLTVTIPQLVGPGIDKTNIVKVSDDGNISLPMIDPVPAAGSTVTDLKQRIIAKYREANLILDATVSVTAAPSTRPATMPAPQPIASASATTLPSDELAPATQPARVDGIDVVVVIEKTAAK